MPAIQTARKHQACQVSLKGLAPEKMARNGCARQRVEDMAGRTLQVTHGCRPVQLPIQLGSLTVSRTGCAEQAKSKAIQECLSRWTE